MFVLRSCLVCLLCLCVCVCACTRRLGVIQPQFPPVRWLVSPHGSSCRDCLFASVCVFRVWWQTADRTSCFQRLVPHHLKIKLNGIIQNCSESYHNNSWCMFFFLNKNDEHYFNLASAHQSAWRPFICTFINAGYESPESAPGCLPDLLLTLVTGSCHHGGAAERRTAPALTH